MLHQYTFTIFKPSSLLASVILTSPSYHSSNDGEIKISSTSGVKPFSYLLNGGTWQVDTVFNNQAAGSYRIQVKDALGMVVSFNRNLIAPPSLVHSTVLDTPFC